MKIGIIGSSSISEKFCNAVLKQTATRGDIVLYANYSRNLNKAKAFAQNFGILHSFDNKVELLNVVDLVYIATPNKMHYDDVKLALNNNTHVLVEKPMTTTASQTSELFEIALSKNLVLVEAIKTCSMNTYQHIIENLEMLGEIKSFRFNMMRAYANFPTNTKEQLANVYRLDMEGGVINDLGSYPLFPLIDFIFPNYTAEQIKFKTIISNYGLDVDSEAIINVTANANDPHGLITISMFNQDDSLSYIYGTLGYLTIDSISQFNQIKYYDLDHNLILEVNRDSTHLMASELLHTISLIETNTLESNIHARSKSIKVAALIENLHSK